MRLKQLNISVVADSKELEWAYEFLTAHGESTDSDRLRLGELLQIHTIAILCVADVERPPGSASPHLN